ncbi:MAG: phosphoglycerate kinase [Desulfuromonadales bacterium C00003068]|jgi:phosphoglycerate kinase|nr:MAG: phosphoglycerate kinase [Desulfuromonadales bacterium C00003068]
MLNKVSISDLDLQGKKVFCRVDFNVPLDDEQKITDDTRIIAALPTIRYILAQGGKLILASHLGRPKGKNVAKLSLAPIAPFLSKLLQQPVTIATDCIGTEVELLIDSMDNGDVILLENVRFHPQEEKNDPHFSEKLAQLADIYVNDAFGTAHRAHASTEGITQYIDCAAAGFLMAKELQYLGQALDTPKRPFVAVLGGAKVSDKITVINQLIDKVDSLLIGGGMAYTFLKAQGYCIGTSLVEEDQLELALSLLKKAKDQGVDLLLPEDHIIAQQFSKDATPSCCGNDNFPADQMALDIGPKTAQRYAKVMSSAATVVWNGPMGVFEFPNFAKGTFTVAEALAESTAISIIGGGDSVAAVNKAGLNDKMTHISTGGGASLEFLEGKTLPGIAALTDK